MSAVNTTVVPIRAPSPPSGTASIAKAIASVMKEVDIVAKSGKNSFHGYKYAKMEDILKEITPLLGRHGLVVFQSETGRAMFDNDNVIAVEYAFQVAHESGEIWPHTLRQTGVSKCRDSKGGWDDKSLNKCHTAARKYFLLALFQIPTGEEDDADKGDNDGNRRKTTLPKKDCRDIYSRLQSELDGMLEPGALLSWGSANAERIKMLPEDWQDILRLRYQERMIDLKQRSPTCHAEGIAHDADGVIWEENEIRSRTPSDVVIDHTDHNGVPAFLDRTGPKDAMLLIA